jgi:two-component system, OmpR family, response regulator
MRLLLIEDNARVASSLEKNLRKEGYVLDIAATGKQGLHLSGENEYDAIILDIMLPDQDGWDTCKLMRKSDIHAPVLMLTALGDVNDKIRGLDSGADDYLVKPYHFGELLARLRSLLRRKTEVRSSVVDAFGVQLDPATRKVFRDGKEIVLATKEFALMEMLMIHAGRIVSREKIAEHLWDSSTEPRSNAIEAQVKFLRQKIDKQFDKPLIHTIRGAGYMFSDEEPR